MGMIRKDSSLQRINNVRIGNNISTNREYKDRLFCLLFGTEKYKKHLLDLYNALSNTNYNNLDELEITTIEDAIYMKMKNDISFILDSVMTVYEQQSTVNPNMPLREFEYCASLYDKYIANKSIYGSKLIKIPTPNCVVFYNGTKERPEREVLRLSDAFEIPTTGYEWTTTVINLNKGFNEDIKDKCYMLERYSSFISMVYAKTVELSDATKAINETVAIFIEQGGDFGTFLLEHKSEVCGMILTEFNEELYEKELKEDAMETGVERGIKITLVSMIRNMDNEKFPIEMIVKATKEDLDFINNVIDLTHSHPDASDAEIADML